MSSKSFAVVDRSGMGLLCLMWTFTVLGERNNYFLFPDAMHIYVGNGVVTPNMDIHSVGGRETVK